MTDSTLKKTLRAVHRRIPERARRRLRPALERAGLADPTVADTDHPERLAVLDHVGDDPVLEIGCGPRKTRSDFIGVDLVPGGALGTVGNAAGRASEADVAADGSVLPFAPSSFGSVVARHNLEHYVDLIAVLREWQRVLRPSGRVILVVPDEDAYDGRTLDLDPTHFHAFNTTFARGLLELLGWQVAVVEPCVPRWSLLIVATTPA